uniref:Uncharacterized protein n=2 Tax=environmental samples TaxID=651140 RepID=A0A075GND5_9ARCH|nr:hypothetical protein [uncultured marine thaumarchaeote KM3_163_G06]AIF11139.1 hypothetical protein [uncultured marine thaumarchaeote KM3_50_F11]
MAIYYLQQNKNNPSHLRIVRYISMSEENKIDIKHLQLLVLQESENDVMQKLDSNLYNSISKFIGDLKSAESDGIDAKIKNTLLDMVTELASSLLKLRLEKASLNNSNSSALLDVEKYILDSQKEMEERKDMILSRILNGKPELLGSHDQ